MTGAELPHAPYDLVIVAPDVAAQYTIAATVDTTDGSRFSQDVTVDMRARSPVRWRQRTCTHPGPWCGSQTADCS
jgi:hypothetical protein